MRWLLCLVLFFGLAAPARAHVNLLPNGDFEQGFRGWEQRGDWRIVPLDGHAAGVAVQRPETARLCARTRAQGTAALRVRFVYRLRGDGRAVVSLGEQTVTLPRAHASHVFEWQTPRPTALPAARFCVDVTAPARFRIDDIMIEEQ